MNMRKVQKTDAAEMQFHLARSEFLDAFAKLEAKIRWFQDLAGMTDTSEPLIQRVAKLRDRARCPNFSDRRATHICTLLQDVEEMVDKRNTIVHSTMGIKGDGATGITATFINPRLHCDGTYHGYRFTIDDLRILIADVNAKTSDLGNLLMLG